MPKSERLFYLLGLLGVRMPSIFIYSNAVVFGGNRYFELNGKLLPKD